MPHLILFVCTGNICRSPMAAALFNARVQRAGEQALFYGESAGTWAMEHQPASSLAVTTLARRNIDLTRHSGRMIDAALMATASVIIVMTRNHYDALHAEFPAYRSKLHMISELQAQLYDIQDPYGGTPAEYEQCATQLQNLIEQGYPKIKAWANTSCSPNL